jgi:hypothetical protein
MIDRAASADPHLRTLLAAHPRIASIAVGEHSGIDFSIGTWNRSVVIGDPILEVAGLVELIDNNPMVCADRMSVADPLSTAALVGLGPLAWAGMILEPPTVISSMPGDEALLDAFMKTAGWSEGVTLHSEPKEMGGVIAITAMAAIPTPSDWSEIDDLYAERYVRSFFVRRDEESEWDPTLVAGRPFALYRLRYTPGDESSLLTIQVLADEHGKCGRSQVIHAMNVMAGFEESLGVS